MAAKECGQFPLCRRIDSLVKKHKQKALLNLTADWKQSKVSPATMKNLTN